MAEWSQIEIFPYYLQPSKENQANQNFEEKQTSTFGFLTFFIALLNASFYLWSGLEVGGKGVPSSNLDLLKTKAQLVWHLEHFSKS